MIKRYFAALAAVFLIASQAMTLASGAQAVSYPSAEPVVLEGQGSFTVSEASLSFEIEPNANDGEALAGQLSSDYLLTNPGTEASQITLGLPFVCGLDVLSPDIAELSAGGEALSPRVFFGDAPGEAVPFSPESYPELSFERIVAAMGEATQVIDGFRPGDTCRVYTISATEESGFESVSSIAVDFDVEAGRSVVITSGFNGGSWDGSHYEATCLTDGSAFVPLKLFVIGEDISNIDVTPYADKDMESEAKGFSCDVSVMWNTVYDLLLDEATAAVGEYKTFVNRGFEDWELMYAQLYDCALGALLSMMEENAVCTDNQLAQALLEPRVVVFAYELMLEPGAALHIKAKRPISSTVDVSSATSPVFSFAHLFGSDGGWSIAGNVDATVQTAEPAPYMVEASEAFSSDAPGRYSIELEPAQGKLLSFKLYSKDSVTVIDKAGAFISKGLSNVDPLVMYTAAAVTAGFIWLLIRSARRRRKRKGAQR